MGEIRDVNDLLCEVDRCLFVYATTSRIGLYLYQSLPTSIASTHDLPVTAALLSVSDWPFFYSSLPNPLVLR